MKRSSRNVQKLCKRFIKIQKQRQKAVVMFALQNKGLKQIFVFPLMHELYKCLNSDITESTRHMWLFKEQKANSSRAPALIYCTDTPQLSASYLIYREHRPGTKETGSLKQPAVLLYMYNHMSKEDGRKLWEILGLYRHMQPTQNLWRFKSVRQKMNRETLNRYFLFTFRTKRTYALFCRVYNWIL